MIGQEGNWCWEVTQVRLRKTAKYGNTYTGIANFTIVNGKLCIEGVHYDNFTWEDYSNLKTKGFGFSAYDFIR